MSIEEVRQERTPKTASREEVDGPDTMGARQCLHDSGMTGSVGASVEV